MSVYYTSEQLIDSVKRRISIPTNQNTYTDADILAFADEETMLAIVPAIMSLHEDYLLFKDDVDLVANQNEYVIPYRSVGNKLNDLQYIDTQGVPFLMARSTVAEEPWIGQSSVNGRTPFSYYIMNNRINLMPSIGSNASGSLRFIYYIRPSSLVLTTAVGVITNINTSTGDITVSALPSTFDTSETYDFYKARSPHNILSKDLTCTGIVSGAKTISFAPADLPSTLEVGDHVALSEQCAIPQIPSDLHVFLAQKTAERVLEAQGDLEGFKLAQAKSQEMEMRAGNIIDNRVDESPHKLINRAGPLRSGLLQRWSRKRG
jgi:hypothetical protein